MNRINFSLLFFGALVCSNLAVAEVVPIMHRGEVRVIDVKGSRVLAEGEVLKESAVRLLSGSNAQIQLRAKDGSLITLSSDSELSIEDTDSPRVVLERGGLTILPANGRSWRVQSGSHSILTTGMLRLVRCAENCLLAKGLYGKISSGEAIVEFSGGRSVLRKKPFRVLDDGSRPEILATEPAFVLDMAPLEYAKSKKDSIAQTIRTAVEHFQDGRHAVARELLLEARQAAPSEAIVLYYLGLNALDERKDDDALSFLNRYAQEDPAGAQERKLGELLTLLSTSELRKEAERAVQQEATLTSQPPEPNTVAVHPFTNQGDPSLTPLAKGIASMLIADLSKVPGLKVLEREKVQRILDEAHLSESQLVDRASAVRAGRLIRAEKVVVGKFGVQ